MDVCVCGQPYMYNNHKNLYINSYRYGEPWQNIMYRSFPETMGFLSIGYVHLSSQVATIVPQSVHVFPNLKVTRYST